MGYTRGDYNLWLSADDKAGLFTYTWIQLTMMADERNF